MLGGKLVFVFGILIISQCIGIIVIVAQYFDVYELAFDSFYLGQHLRSLKTIVIIKMELLPVYFGRPQLGLIVVVVFYFVDK